MESATDITGNRKTNNKTNYTTERNFGTQILLEVNIIHNIKVKATLKYASEAWVWIKRDMKRDIYWVLQDQITNEIKTYTN
jgi:hypothetical protein